MTGQIAVAALLLVGASLLGRSLLAMRHVDRGYDPGNLLTATIPMPDAQFICPRRAAILDAILERLSGTPGVAVAAAASVMPLLPFEQSMSFPIQTDDGKGAFVPAHTTVRLVSPGYFAALGRHIIEGRAFAETDTNRSLVAAIVNRTFARTYFKRSAAFGRSDSRSRRALFRVT